MLANKLQVGDTIGVIAPDKVAIREDKEDLENATKYFESLGLKVKYGKYLFSENEYCAGTPKERAKDLNNMFSDKEVKGKIYGTNIIGLLKLVGTPYMPYLENAVLFLEGFHSNIIQWNTMLEQYNQINSFNKAVVFGYIHQLQYVEKNKYSIVDELRKINSDITIVKTNDFGHIHANSIIPIGAEVTINENEQSIIVSDYLK